MKWHQLWITAFCASIVSTAAFGAQAPGTGVIKGTITIGGRPTEDAVVSVEGATLQQDEARISGGTRPAVIDQRDMKFIPRVLAVPVRKTVDFPNNDKTFHNVFSVSEAKKFDLGLYPSGQSRNVNFDKPGVVKILCNVHPNMEAYIVVKEHPYFSVADSRGRYNIESIPLGKYRLEVWHPELGSTETAGELVRDGQVLDIDFDLKKERR